jgi:GIY-YIG catalytic domain.
LKARINKKHFELCVSLYKNPITLDLPIPHTDKISDFSKVAGVENLDSLRKSGKFVPGCYRIYGIGNSPDMCYIGQALHLGLRVKQHAKGSNKNTSDFCMNLGNKGKVDLFILPGLENIPKGLSISEFLCVLEQYLIFKYRPKINKLFIASPSPREAGAGTRIPPHDVVVRGN